MKRVASTAVAGLLVLATCVVASSVPPETFTYTYVASPVPLPESLGGEKVNGIGVFDRFVFGAQGWRTVSFSAADQRGPVGLRYRFTGQPAAGTLVCNGASGVPIPGGAVDLFVWFQSPPETPPPGCAFPPGGSAGTFTATFNP